MRILPKRLAMPSALLLLLAGAAAQAEDKYDESLRRFQVNEHAGAVTAVAISPDGKTLATAGKDGAIRFFDLVTGKRANMLRHQSEIWAIGYSGDGKSFAFSDGDRVVTVVDPQTLKEKAAMKDQFETPVAMLSLSPDGSLLATIEDGLQVPHCWELPSGKARAVFEGHGDKVNSVAFSPDGKRVATTSGDETIRLWDATAAGIPGRPLRGHDGPVFLAVFSPDGKTLVSAGTRDKTVRLWDLATFKVQTVMEGHEGEVHFVGFGAGGAMVSLSKDGVAKMWNADGKETGSFRWAADGGELPAYGTSVALSPDGKTLAVGHDDVVDVWDLMKVKAATTGSP
ncbi:MAG TPA: WD40 repeat domain-containing protein [Gemmataceae bacterium]|nr:WD40 repeat domain-containing protein [Gemmataceae bacterium]